MHALPQLGPSTTPDLRKLNDGLHMAFKDILLRGVLAPAGMERFNDILSDKDADNIHAYLIEQSLDRLPRTAERRGGRVGDRMLQPGLMMDRPLLIS